MSGLLPRDRVKLHWSSQLRGLSSGLLDSTVVRLLGQSERRPELVLPAQPQFHHAASWSVGVLMSQPARYGLGLGLHRKQEMQCRTPMDVKKFPAVDSKRSLAEHFPSGFLDAGEPHDLLDKRCLLHPCPSSPPVVGGPSAGQRGDSGMDGLIPAQLPFVWEPVRIF